MGMRVAHFSPVVEAKKLGPSPSNGKYLCSNLSHVCCGNAVISRVCNRGQSWTSVQCALILQPSSRSSQTRMAAVIWATHRTRKLLSCTSCCSR